MTVAQQSALALRDRLKTRYPTVQVQVLAPIGNEVVPTIWVQVSNNVGGIPTRFRGMAVVVKERSRCFSRQVAR